MSHAGFLRDVHSVPEDELIAVVRGLVEAGEEAGRRPLERGLQHVLTAIDRLLADAPSLVEHERLLHLVARLTLVPRSMRAVHLLPLRERGYSHRELHDVVHVVACFSYMNRLADGLGVTAHPEPDGWAERLLGRERTEAHRAWARGD